MWKRALHPLISCLAAIAVAAGAAVVTAATPAGAVQAPHDVVVSDDPANWTPHVLDGRVNTVAQVGDTIYLGGSFSRVRAANSSAELNRANFLAFDATTGAIRPLDPRFGGEINKILPAPDGQSLYVGGNFTTLNGQTVRRLARISTATGAPVPGFNVPTLNGSVKDLALVGGRLWLAGAFTHVAGVAQLGLATINPNTGAFDPYMRLTFSGTHNGGTTQVLKIDATPDGSRLFAIGNFATVDGASHHQVAALSLTGPSAAIANWRTTFFTSTCSSNFNTYMRDLDVSPDGTYVVFTTTGAYAGGPPRSCDTHSRFEVGATGSNVQPTWVNYTGGDTSYAVAVTGEAVYVGGHFRWVNNPSAGDRAGAGAVARSGIAALDPANGLPLAWDPGRTLGVGVFDILATPTGLWVASDTDRIGNFEFHGRIAFFPLAGGTDLPPNRTGHLPGQAILLDPPTANNAVVARDFDGDVAGPPQALPNGGINWDLVRGAVMIDGTVYAGFRDNNGTFAAFTFDGETWGPLDPVDTHDQLVALTAWDDDVRNMTGLFFADGRLYFTRSGQDTLFYRYFTPANQVIGGQRFTASGNVPGIDFGDVRSMFYADGHLYWATADGTLRRIDFAGGGPVGGTAEVVSGPNVDGVDWRARAVFLSTLGEPPAPDLPPTAALTVSCDDLTCAVDGSGSTDDSAVVDYAWDWGDGSPGDTGATATHTYDEAGTYTITLTVTDDGGQTGTATQDVTVAIAAADIEFVGANSTNVNATTHQVAIPAGVQAGDALLLFASSNNTAASMSAPSGGGAWTLVDTVETASIETAVWRAEATGGGGTVQLSTSEYAKVALTVLAYRGTAADPVAQFAVQAETTSRTVHSTPTVDVTGAGQWVVSYWAHRDSTSTSLTAGGVTARSTTAGSGGGRVLALAADSGGPVGTGGYGGIPATTQGASAHATMWTIVLARAGGGDPPPPPPPPPDTPPTAHASVTCDGLACSADGSGSTDDGTIVEHSWDWGDGSPADTGATAAHTYAAAGTYTITLTVTDDTGETGSTTVYVTVAPVTSEIAFVGASSANANAMTHQVGIPAGVQAGDALLLFASSNNVGASLSPPSGGGTWTLLDTVQTSSVVTSVWRAQATGSGTVQVSTSDFAKVALTVLAYRGTAADPVAAFAAAAETTSGTTHTTPTVAVSGSGRWVVSYWAHKDSTSTSMTAPGTTSRSLSVGSGGGRVLALAADSGGPVPPGTAGGVAATTQGASGHATMWTIVLAPA